MSIALIGLPGSGKTTIGKQLAKRVHLDFYDSDVAIEQRQGCSIRSIFDKLGEARFREIEAKVLEELCSKERCVISTGGGAVLSPSNRTLLKERCICIYLRSNPEELIRRLRNDRKRPLLQVEDPLGVLRELFLQRDQLYEEAASFVVDTGRPSVHAVVNTISRHLDSLPLGILNRGQTDHSVG